MAIESTDPELIIPEIASSILAQRQRIEQGRNMIAIAISELKAVGTKRAKLAEDLSLASASGDKLAAAQLLRLEAQMSKASEEAAKAEAILAATDAEIAKG